MSSHDVSPSAYRVFSCCYWLSGYRRGVVVVSLLVLSLVFSAIAGMASPQRAPQVPAHHPDPMAEMLTQDLVDLQARYRQASPAPHPPLLGHLVRVAAARQQLLAELMEDNPAEVLRVALPAALRAHVPPAVQAYVEEAVEVEGEIEVLHEDRDTGSRYRYFLQTAWQRLALHFAAPPPDVLTGTRVRVKGLRVGEALALESGTTSLQTLSSALPNTFGGQKTLVILVNFRDNPTQPYTPDYARNVVLTSTSNYFWDNSYQQTWLIGDVVGWYTIALDSTVCNASSLASYAKSAATAAGVNLSAYNRLVYAFPQNACIWWGLGSVGGNPSQAWSNGSLQFKVAGHELGHNLGLYHSQSLDCGADPIGSSCTASEYGDTLDIMGNPSSGHFNAFQKDRLGWLDDAASPPITNVQTSGTFTIAPYAAMDNNPKALSVLQATNPQTGQRTWYYVEYRQALGFDSFLSSNTNVTKGVIIHTGSEATGNSSYLLDMTPETASWSDPALVAGQSFTDPDAGVTISPVSVNSAGATVAVNFGPIACVHADPTLVLSPTQSQWVSPGTPVTYSVSVTSNDNTACSASNFSLLAAALEDWTAVFATPDLFLTPGATASTMFQLTSPSTEAEGFYSTDIMVIHGTDAAYMASATATVVLGSALDVTVTADQATYVPNQWVTLTASVQAGGTPRANAPVTFTVTRANGTSFTQTATTGAGGTAVYKFRPKKNDPLGTYQVTATATVNALTGSAGVSFTVKR